MSQRNRPPRGGARTGAHENGEEAGIWAQCQEDLKKFARLETRAAEINLAIQAKELEIKAKEPTKPSVEELDALDALYRDQIRLAESIKSLGIVEKLGVLKAVVHDNENQAQLAMGRSSNSRESKSAMELDGPADSPAAPSPAPPRRQQGGTSRTGSQPPSVTSGTTVQDNADERGEGSTNKTKIVFAVDDEIAFKPKQTPGQDATEWIQGIVTKVIGEGKSRRYDVKDPFPPEGEEPHNYRSSASSMVAVPPVGTKLPDFEVGKEVLALYPSSSCFYRAEVKSTQGDKVELLFEDDEADTLRLVERRYVFDIKITKDNKR